MNDLNNLLPVSVTVNFPQQVNGASTTVPYTITVALVSLAIQRLAGVKGHPGTHLLFSTNMAATTVLSGTATNQAELLALAEQLAADWYLWQLGRLSLKYSGIAPYIPDGFSDLEFLVWEGEVSTRVERLPWEVALQYAAGSAGYGPDTFFYNNVNFFDIAGDLSVAWNAAAGTWEWIGSTGTSTWTQSTNVWNFAADFVWVGAAGNSTYTQSTSTWSFYGAVVTAFFGLPTTAPASPQKGYVWCDGYYLWQYHDPTTSYPLVPFVSTFTGGGATWDLPVLNTGTPQLLDIVTSNSTTTPMMLIQVGIAGVPQKPVWEPLGGTTSSLSVAPVGFPVTAGTITVTGTPTFVTPPGTLLYDTTDDLFMVSKGGGNYSSLAPLLYAVPTTTTPTGNYYSATLYTYDPTTATYTAGTANAIWLAVGNIQSIPDTNCVETTVYYPVTFQGDDSGRPVYLTPFGPAGGSPNNPGVYQPGYVNIDDINGQNWLGTKTTVGSWWCYNGIFKCIDSFAAGADPAFFWLYTDPSTHLHGTGPSSGGNQIYHNNDGPNGHTHGFETFATDDHNGYGVAIRGIPGDGTAYPQIQFTNKLPFIGQPAIVLGIWDGTSLQPGQTGTGGGGDTFQGGLCIGLGGGGGGSGTVTSVDFSGGSTGLTASGGPITGSGTFVLAGALNTANGGTDADLSATGPGVVVQTGLGASLGVLTNSPGVLSNNGFGSLSWVTSTPAGSVLAGFTQNTTTPSPANIVYNDSTFTGGTGSNAYMLGDVVAALKAAGLLTP